MIRSLNPLLIFALAWPWISREAPAQDATPAGLIKLTVKAGNHDRASTLIRFSLPLNRLDPPARQALDQGPIVLMLTGRIKKPGGSEIAFWSPQVDRDPDGLSVHVTFTLSERLPKGEEVEFLLNVKGPVPVPASSWTLTESQPGALDLKWRDKPVFRYNASPVSSPKYGEIQHRDGYIHPAFSPSGALITGDFSTSHPHHRGFFLAYEKTRTGNLTPDFWNIHLGTGKIYSEGFEKPVLGFRTARFSAKHRWDAKDKSTGKDVTVLRERWDVEAYATPELSYWLFDITSTQQAVDRPMELLPYRYGGMAYRGPEPFVKGLLDVLTSEGLNRKNGDQKLARWVDLTGPISDGSDKYAGAMIADHPSNPNYPNVVRIHPTSLPFFCYVPSHDKPLTIAVDKPTVFRYRVLIHDGHPDQELNERIARDFAEPPVVVVE
jgi:hypothetical protein